MKGYSKTRGVGRKGRGGIVGKYELKLESLEEWYTYMYVRGRKGGFKLHVINLLLWRNLK